jgi:hypothetical protein
MVRNATLYAIDLRTSRTEEYARSSIPDDVVTRLAPVLRDGHGDICSHWYLEIMCEHRFVAQSLPGLPGTAYGALAGKATYRAALGGVRFSLSAKSGRGEPCLIGWLAWRKTVDGDVWDDVIATLRQRASELGSLCPFNVPGKPSTSPWLATLCMPPWYQLSSQELAELAKVRPWIGWSAIEALSCEQG